MSESLFQSVFFRNVRAQQSLIAGIVLVVLCLCLSTMLRADTAADNTLASVQLEHWSDGELKLLQSLSIDNLPSLPASAGNRFADDDRAAVLGHRIFFDTAFSSTGTIACATCHQPEHNFSDGLAKGKAIGETDRRTMSLLGVAYSPWFFWDGRSDSLWAQALEPLEKSTEHGGTRVQYLHLLASDERLRKPYETLFGKLPTLEELQRFPATAGPLGNEARVTAWHSMTPQDRALANHVFANIGRLLEAYQRRLLPGPSKLDHYIRALESGDTEIAATALTTDQRAGLRLFIGKARCMHCHNGPLLTNNDFHNTGLFPPDTLPVDRGRIEAIKPLLASEFNCLSVIAVSDRGDCEELEFVKTHGLELVAAFRTPSLRGMHQGPFMHTGGFSTMAQVLQHYNKAQATLISDDLVPLNLSETELKQLEVFLESVISAPAVSAQWLQPPK